MQTPTSTQLRRYYQSGFTLIELLIVIAIIGILAAIAVPQYGNYLDRSARTACVSELSSFRSIVISESAVASGNGQIVAGNENVDGYSFEACNVPSTEKVALANVFVNGGERSVPVTRQGADAIGINNGQIDVATTQ